MLHHDGDIPIQAHRGAGADWPENTVESCQVTWAGAPRLIPELDVSTTADGVLVAFHDRDLRRLLGAGDPALAGQRLQDVSWDQVRQLDVGAAMGPQFRGQFVPRLVDAFELLAGRPQRRLYLDYKHASLADLAERVYQHGVARQVILSAPNPAVLVEWRARVPESETLLWIENHGPEAMSRRVEEVRRQGFAGLTQLQLHTRVTDVGAFVPSSEFLRGLARECRQRGLLLQAFPFSGAFAGCCDPAAFGRLLALGVASLATDDPRAAWRAVEQFQTPRAAATEAASPPP